MRRWVRQALVLGSLVMVTAVGLTGQTRAGTGDQVEKGLQVYQAQCAGCHGDTLGGLQGPALAREDLLPQWRGDFAAMRTYVQRNMPPGMGNTLTLEESLNVTHFIFSRNGVEPDGFADPAFRDLWRATDGRLWGPVGFAVVWEPYQAAPGGAEVAGGQRLVQYFDKGRMERTRPDGPVEAGLLAVELITGRQQDGDATFVDREPAKVTVAGDPDNPFPTYADLDRLRARETNNTAAGTPITKLYRPDRSIGIYTAAVNNPMAVTAGYDDTGHNLPRAFADFRDSPDFGGLTAIGLAITEPVWAEVKLGNQTAPVLIQAFERRVLTYTPSNPVGSQVEYGNVGQAYHRWRYGG